jgi:two-component system OmpR family response regulator
MSRPLVLVVEDERVVREPLAKFLTLHGFDVCSADSVASARAALAERPVDAAIVDLRLPQESGHEIVRAIPPPVPVIIFSAVPQESERLEDLRPNTRLVMKPFSLTLLAEMLRDMIARRGDGEA